MILRHGVSFDRIFIAKIAKDSLEMDVLDTQIHAVIGDEGFTRLVAAFFRRIPTDDLLGPMYQNSDLKAAEWRLREFLIGRFGGPQTYIQHRGHPRLGMRHIPFAIDQTARDRWISLMSAALDEAKLPAEADAMLRKFFEDSATFLINRKTV
jgi:hemoglobin